MTGWINEEFDKFMEFDTDNRSLVTSVSAKLFAEHCVARLEKAIIETIEENLDMADGDNCTLIKLKNAVCYK